MHAHNADISEIRKRAAGALAAIALVAAAAGTTLVTAAPATVRLLGVSTSATGVEIEATEPVAYTVNRPDPLTLVVDLRGTSVAEASSRVDPKGIVSGVRLEQASAADGVPLARVRMTLSRAAQHTVKSARNTIVVELTPAAANASTSRRQRAAASAVAPPAKQSAPAPTAGTLQDADLERLGAEAIPLEQALANGATLAAPDEPVEAPRPAAPRPSAAAPASGSAKDARQPAVQPAAARETTNQVEAIAALKTVPPAARQSASPQTPAPASVVLPPSAEATPAPAQQLDAAPELEESRPALRQPPTGTAPALQGTAQDISTGQEKKYTGHPISMDFQGVDLRSVLRTFAEISGLNMVIDPDVQGTVDIVLTDVPWDQALEVILRGNSLDYTVDGTIVRIARIETLRKEQEARAQLAQSQANAGALAVRTYTLSYAKADQAAPLIKSSVLSPRGSVQIDARTNTLIITDLPARLDTVSQLLATLDRAEPQVEIEARIITTTREFARALGVQWGFNGRVNSTIGNTTNLAFPNNGSLGGRVGGTQGPGGTDPRAGALDAAGTAVNLGVDTASSAVGLALGSINGAFNLDVALSALERTGKGRILSTPRVTTQNNVEAEITQGVQIPVQTEANNTVTVTFKDAALTLKVTPQITAANTVIMQITLENGSVGTLVNGIPSIDTQRAITRVQVSDGTTTVMGGIFVSRENTTNDRTPVLHRIPFLGWLFRRDSIQDESRELLIFITPRILKG